MSQPSRLVCELVDRRDEYCCVRCGRYLIGNPASRHHRKLRSQASLAEVHNPSNLILLCGTGTTGCHGWVHAHPAEACRYGWMVRSYREVWDIAVLSKKHGWIFLDDDGGWIHVEDEEDLETNERKALI